VQNRDIGVDSARLFNHLGFELAAGAVTDTLRFARLRRCRNAAVLSVRPSEQASAGMVTECIPHVASECVHALTPAHIHHLEEIGPLRRGRGQKSRPHAVSAVLSVTDAIRALIALGLAAPQKRTKGRKAGVGKREGGS
jgi:hypothetical protein